MLRQPVSSSNLRSVGYDDDSGVLEVEFTNGAVYQYLEVPDRIYSALVSASSKGKYLHQAVKGKFPYRQVPRS